MHNLTQSITDTDYAIAVDIGGTHLRIARISTSYQYEIISLRKTPRTDSNKIIESILDATETCRNKLNRDPCGIGICAAGLVDKRTGILYPPNLPYDEISLVKPITDESGLFTSLLNDCRAGVFGERYAGFGSHGNSENLLYMTFSTGIGLGALCNDHLIEGENGNAGEVGHIPVRTSYEARCSCGKWGHWEGYASGSGMPRFFDTFCAEQSIITSPVSDSKEIFKRALEKDPVAIDFLNEVATINGNGFATVIMAYDPDHIVIEGPIMRNNPWFFQLSCSKIDIHFKNIPSMTFSSLNAHAPLIGSVVPVFKAVLSE
jgi:glucokinase